MRERSRVNIWLDRWYPTIVTVSIAIIFLPPLAVYLWWVGS